MKFIKSHGAKYVRVRFGKIALKVGKDKHGQWFTQWLKKGVFVSGAHGRLLFIIKRLFSLTRLKYVLHYGN